VTSKIKRLVAEELLATESGFMVSMNVEHPDVEIPPHVKFGALRLSPEIAVVSLIIGHRLAVPIQDLIMDEDGITATLTFHRTLHWCSMPWGAIVGFADRDGKPIVAFNAGGKTEPKAPRLNIRATLKPKPKRPALRLVQGDESA
jgi:hypothetical protein